MREPCIIAKFWHNVLMKKIPFLIALFVLFVGQAAYAQAYYANPASTAPYAGGCVSLTRDLFVGSKGADVLSLQKFILTRNYPGAGAWMLTSYYGAATRAGVINFQTDMRLPQTGVLDSATRAALLNFTCGYTHTNSYNNSNIFQPWYNYGQYTYGTNYNGNCSVLYGNTNCQCGWYTVAGQNYYNNCGGTSTGINVTSLSPNSGAVGTFVTVYGSGFSYTNNSVRFGSGVIAGINSVDGRTLTFTVPATLSGYGYSSVTPGVYNVSVTNSAGATSNAIPFVVNSTGTSNANAPWISNVSGPNTIAVNTTGTWIVSINNPNTSNYTSVSVNWGDANNSAYMSAPQQIYGTGQSATFTHAYSQSGTYTITFTASNGNGSNTSSVTVQVNGSSTNAPYISSITPTYGRAGTQIVIYGTGFTGDNTVHFGIGGQKQLTSMSGNYIYYTVPSTLSPCDVVASGSYCAQYLQQVTPGQYQIYVTANGVNSNSVTFTVQ
jgi:hypothetical protein